MCEYFSHIGRNLSAIIIDNTFMFRFYLVSFLFVYCLTMLLNLLYMYINVIIDLLTKFELFINKVISHFQNDLDDPERGMILVCSATHKTKSMFFFLVQTEQGDVFKVTLETNEEFVTEIRLKYFDTVPVASAMCVLKTGFLFVASEFGNQ